MRACVCARACVRVRWCECGAVQHAERAPQLDDTDNKRAPQTQTGQLTRRCCHSTFVGGASGLLNGRARGAAAVPVFVSGVPCYAVQSSLIFFNFFLASHRISACPEVYPSWVSTYLKYLDGSLDGFLSFPLNSNCFFGFLLFLFHCTFASLLSPCFSYRYWF